MSSSSAAPLAEEAETALEREFAAFRLAASRAAEVSAAALAAANANAAAAKADVTAAKADATAAKADATGERAARIAAETTGFLNDMRGVAGSSSVDTTPRADVHRRGATDPVAGDEEAVLASLPLTARGSVARAWTAFARAHAREWLPPPARFSENHHMHPTIARMLDAVVAREELRVWHERTAEDDVAAAKIRPDFTLTHVRDTGVSTVGAAIMIEVKLPNAPALDDAVTKLCAYLRLRVYKLCCERFSRGEPFHDIFALGAASNGRTVVLVRILSGAPAPGGSFPDAVPCPSISTTYPLLDWDFCTRVDFARFLPPAGFAALARLCCSAGALGDAAPLASLRANVAWVKDGVGAPRVAVELELGLRLGSGGTSDAYEWAADATAVVKVSRCQTVEIVADFAAEERALELLRTAAAAGLVPELVGAGARASAAGSGAHDGGAWPLLVLRPRGVPLAQWVATVVARSSVRDKRAARRAAASAVVGRVLNALEHAAAAGVVHCDVRPANIVVVDDLAVLVDWGCSCARDTDARGRGVPAYADARIFAPATTSFKARPVQDVAGALYTWLAIACDAGCVAPWLALPAAPAGAQLEAGTPVPGVLERRAAWIAAAPERGDVTGPFMAALAAATTGKGADDASVFARARAAIVG